MPSSLHLLTPDLTGRFHRRRAPLTASVTASLRAAALRLTRVYGRGKHVYVILLDPPRAGAAHELYVGKSFRTPENRFLQHKSGVHASSRVKRRGIGLLPDLYLHLNPLGGAEADRVERDLAEALRSSGLRVWQR